jgi:hypothetical protein
LELPTDPPAGGTSETKPTSIMISATSATGMVMSVPINTSPFLNPVRKLEFMLPPLCLRLETSAIDPSLKPLLAIILYHFKRFYLDGLRDFWFDINYVFIKYAAE